MGVGVVIYLLPLGLILKLLIFVSGSGLTAKKGLIVIKKIKEWPKNKK